VRNFLSETETNLQAMQSNRVYHEKLLQELTEFLASAEPATEERLAKQVHFSGLKPVDFEHTAWDLALATQSLSYLRSDLAFKISKVYTQQSALQALQNIFLSAAYMPGGMEAENLKGFTVAMKLYLIDVNQKEPTIIESYQKLIPELKAALESDGAQRNSFWSRIVSPLTRH
jgi:zona occludens toxin (predicted ATPase)